MKTEAEVPAAMKLKVVKSLSSPSSAPRFNENDLKLFFIFMSVLLAGGALIWQSSAKAVFY